MLRRNGSGRLRPSQKPNEDINPMNQVANLVDAMLVLAVGIMLALIVSWNLNLSNDGKVEDAKSAKEQKEAVTSFTQDDLESIREEKKEEKDLKKKGEVYYDEKTGTYYIMESGASSSSGDGGQ